MTRGKEQLQERRDAFARNSQIAPNDSYLRVEILVVVLALRRELEVLVPGLGVLEDFPFVIPDHDFFVVVIENVTGIDRHLAAAAGSIDDKLGNSVTRGVTAQPLDNLDAFGNRRAQV